MAYSQCMAEEIVMTSRAAKMVGCHPSTIRAWHRRGVLPGMQLANGVRIFSRSAVEQLARDFKARATADAKKAR